MDKGVLRVHRSRTGFVGSGSYHQNRRGTSSHLFRSGEGACEYVRVVLWFNEGAAFGMTFGGKWAHVILSLIAMVVVTYLVWRTPREHSLMLSGFALILGGAAGNLWDRLLAGKVTDFIDVGIGSLRWPTFNVADASVVVGVFLILLTSWRTSRAEQTAKETTAHPAQTAATEGTPVP